MLGWFCPTGSDCSVLDKGLETMYEIMLKLFCPHLALFAAISDKALIYIPILIDTFGVHGNARK